MTVTLTDSRVIIKTGSTASEAEKKVKIHAKIRIVCFAHGLFFADGEAGLASQPT